MNRLNDFLDKLAEWLGLLPAPILIPVKKDDKKQITARVT
jgi:hypothetical protein